MLLVGYGQIQEGMKLDVFDHYIPYDSITILPGDPRIGKTYWKFKNSWGFTSDNGCINDTIDGFMYMIMNDPSIVYRRYSIETPITSELLKETDIVCEDNDGDGLFNWGIGSNPPHCPAWAAADSDGDDSDWSKGHMNEFGYCEENPINHPLYEYIGNDSTLITSENRTNFLGILRGATVTIKTQLSFVNGTKLLLDNGATLVIDGVTINGDYLQPYVGSKIILNNGAKIQKPFKAPVGVELVINKGAII